MVQPAHLLNTNPTAHMVTFVPHCLTQIFFKLLFFSWVRQKTVQVAVDSPVSCYDHRIRTWAFFAPPDNMLYPLSLDGSSPGMSSTFKEMLATSLSSEPSHRRYRTQLAAQSSDLSPRSGI